MNECINIGRASISKSRVEIDLNKLMVSRLLITAASGGGKSWALRKTLEQASATMQTIVIDPEGEFASLREKRDMVLVGPQGEVAPDPRSAALLCRKLMEMNLSAVIDLSELLPRDRRTFVANYLNCMVNLPRSLWRPCLVAIDEIHEFAPEGENQESGRAVALLGCKGRKRGFCLLGATQRLSKLDKDVAAELKNQMIGQMVLDTDLKRSAATLGFGKEQWPELRDLSEGGFFAFGPALMVGGKSFKGVFPMHFGDVETTHPKPGQGRVAEPPGPSRKIKGVLAELQQLPQQAEAEIRDLESAKNQIADLQRQLRVKELNRPSAPAPVMVPKPVVKILEKPIFTDGQLSRMEKLSGDLARHMEVIRETINKGLESLVKYGQEKHEVQRPVVPTARIVPTPPVKVVIKPSVKTPAISGSVGNDGAKARMLRALSQAPEGLTDRELGIYALISSRSGTFATYKGELKSAGLIEVCNGRMLLTAAGQGDYAPLPRGNALQEEWMKKVGGGAKARMMQVLLDIYPADVTDEEWAQSAQMSMSGTFATYKGELRKLELIFSPSRGASKASVELFN